MNEDNFGCCENCGDFVSWNDETQETECDCQSDPYADDPNKTLNFND